MVVMLKIKIRYKTSYESLFEERGLPVSRKVYLRDKKALMTDIPHLITRASHNKHKSGLRNNISYEIIQSDVPWYAVKYVKIYKGRMELKERRCDSCYEQRDFIRKCLSSKTLRILEVI